MFDVDISSRSIDRFRSVLGDERFAAVERATEEAYELLDGRVVWKRQLHRGGAAWLLVLDRLRPRCPR